jgi:hypothetical protein
LRHQLTLDLIEPRVLKGSPIMKKSLLALAAAAATLAGAPAAAAIVVSMLPAVQSVAVGDSILVDIRISGLGNEILSAFDLNVLFDSALVSNAPGAQGISFFGTQFGPDFVSSASFASGNNGAIGDAFPLPDDDIAAIQTDDSFTFLTFRWTAAADGALFLNFGSDPFFERNVVGRNGDSLNATFQGACVAIGTGDCNRVPEPATYALAGLALLGCGLTSTRRRRAGTPSSPLGRA